MLWREGAVSLSQAHRALGLPIGYTTVQTRLNRLVKKGIVVRRRSDHDRRIVEIDLSPEAHKHRLEYMEKRQAAISAVLETLARQERETVLSLLEKGLRLSAPAVNGAKQ